jgi:hypothetical protein
VCLATGSSSRTTGHEAKIDFQKMRLWARGFYFCLTFSVATLYYSPTLPP